ncbi:MAG: pyrimidine dimer DNA glycosylase/endonuclease V [Rothia sp. (in: high G+C Gram-positive bacteria)]|nr:pyrimidine dimer DNA glycosylase/endonuclease V [Rothia sp. (in: high G+C Gram-positive bacteria)]
MRIWSLHPQLLDAKGLVACWRETLLAQKVLQGLTKGYTHHPQLKRFQESYDALAHLCTYLHGIGDEADRRGYHFDRSKIMQPAQPALSLELTEGQLRYEFEFLQQKVAQRDEKWFTHHLAQLREPTAHPLFSVVPGEIESWEKVKPIS